ncbi:5-guanidino-2-oxopentanoate decarboxylase [Frigidibacter sp. SD6-1]|uniref:5-guanidino-2-oxopentanoate decarboxylase n=1 Tax=Frigidibacter sp. SD6-1 TaxID=3032581 RepID=UPI0024E01D82|nr:5-guanidino-2-oxopentanoate decarboxylase [Frigidibacter sp. SD6-1]
MASVGEELVRGLKARGVEVVFGIPGVHTIELYRGLAGSGIRHVTARHEGGAAFMADGYARVSGKPGVAFVITGPGLLNALTPMGQSREDSVPVLIISGVNNRASLGQGLGFLHELPDQAGMVRPLCPSFQITAPEMVERVLTQAFAALTEGRPGPVHIEVPTDVMPLPCPPLPSSVAAAAPRAPDADQLTEAAALLNRARTPVILAGGGARHAGRELRALAERLDAPVIQTTNARGLLWQHPLSLAASPSLKSVRALMALADQVLAVGTELGVTDYDMYGTEGMPDLAAMIRIDLCAAQLARHPAALAVRAEAGRAMQALLPLLEQKATGAADRVAATMRAARAELTGLSPTLARYLPFVEAMRDAVPGAIIVGDSTQPVYAANITYDHDRPGGWFNAATGFGALGFGPGAAVGAALAAPGAPVICLIGDGGLQFSPGELRTAVDEGLPITFLVWNSASYQEIADAMVAADTEVIGCNPSPLRMEPFAAACDLPFQSVPLDIAALKAALAQAATGPRMIEVRTRPL